MTLFWIAVAGMVLGALLFAVPPLLRKHDDASIDPDQLNTAVVKEQLRELQADLDAGKLDEASHAAAKLDLERELLSQLEANTGTSKAAPRSGRWAAALFGAVIPVMAVLLYLQLGAVDFQAQQQAEAVPGMNGDGHPLAAMVAKLEQRMQQEPDQLEGWLLLARSYAALNRFGDAVEAYAQARRLVGDQPDLLVDSADMLVMANGGRFTDEVGALLERALAMQPDNAKGLWLKGHWKYRNNEIRAAIDNWKQAAALLPAGSDNVIAINQQIRQAEESLGAPESDVAATAPSETGEAQGGAAGSIDVSVSLDPAMSARAAPGDTVFIFARAMQGPRMPLAIVRKQVADLPVRVTLNDSMAMSPAMVLSNFEQVAVGARVSKSGNAMPQSGDLQGMTAPVEVREGTAAEVVINEAIP